MEERPDFKDIKSFEEFKKYYWYREDLIKICKSLGIDSSGYKLELMGNIEKYYMGEIVKKRKPSVMKNTAKEITLDTKLLECKFAFNQRFREVFSKLTGIEKFKFNADMVAAARKVKADNDTEFTIKDLLDIFYKKSDYAKYDNSSCQWNKFLKDFCADEKNQVFKNKLKAASILWGKVRDSKEEKVYKRELINKYFDLIKEFVK